MEASDMNELKEMLKYIKKIEDDNVVAHNINMSYLNNMVKFKLYIILSLILVGFLCVAILANQGVVIFVLGVFILLFFFAGVIGSLLSATDSLKSIKKLKDLNDLK